jgi:hypothetical protein
LQIEEQLGCHSSKDIEIKVGKGNLFGILNDNFCNNFVEKIKMKL